MLCDIDPRCGSVIYVCGVRYKSLKVTCDICRKRQVKEQNPACGRDFASYSSTSSMLTGAKFLPVLVKAMRMVFSSVVSPTQFFRVIL